jgi:hypothetical protein
MTLLDVAEELRRRLIRLVLSESGRRPAFGDVASSRMTRAGIDLVLFNEYFPPQALTPSTPLAQLRD